MAQNIRRPAVAGQFYDGSADALKADLTRCMAEAQRLAPQKASDSTDHLRGEATVQAVIVPHAGYVFSGAVAASAFLRLPADAHYDHVFLLGPSHHAYVDGASVNNAFAAYRTPLGDVPVDTALCSELIRDNAVFHYLSEAHNREHCLEVELPFLQTRLNEVPPIVPIILGTENLSVLRSVAEALKPYFNAHNLFVISSDFCHYPSYDDALTVDSNMAQGLRSGRLADFVAAEQKNASLGIRNLATSACGACAIDVLLLLAEDAAANGQMATDLSLQHVAYRNSGDSPYGGKDEVVGYHAFVLWRKNGTAAVRQDAAQSFVLTAADKRQLLNVAWNAISPADKQCEVRPTSVFNVKCGVFVTLSKHGRLRGCIGHFGEDISLGKITHEMAQAAAYEDPRFPQLRADELPDLIVEISVLTPLHRIHDISEFHYGQQGIYMRKGYHSGTFLPQVADEVNWTKEEFLGHCAQDKAGIGWEGWRTADLYTYEAIRFEEDYGEWLRQKAE
jgi:AmmeMemoRadiSam system protein B/AmmeMemoRadiSam system protein A